MTAHSAFQTAELEIVLYARTEVGPGSCQSAHVGFSLVSGLNTILPVRGTQNEHAKRCQQSPGNHREKEHTESSFNSSVRSFSFDFSTDDNIFLLLILAVVANFLLRTVTTDVEQGFIRIVVGHGHGSADLARRFSFTQVLLFFIQDVEARTVLDEGFRHSFEVSNAPLSAFPKPCAELSAQR